MTGEDGAARQKRKEDGSDTHRDKDKQNAQQESCAAAVLLHKRIMPRKSFSHHYFLI